MSRYTAVTEQDLSEMLATIGVGSIDELFAELVPEGVKLDRELGLPEGMTEQDVYDHLRELAAKNVSTEDEVSFLGAGMYDTYVPAIVDMLTSRSEFLTPYTPYQPEVSQGSLQVMFEYQTAISELTGLPVSNASVYEGPSALAAAGYLAKLANGKGRFVISRAVHPHSRETLVTLARGYGVEVVEVGMRDGVTDPDAWAAAIDDDTSAVFFQQPNFLGAVEDAEALAAAAKNSPAVVVAQVDALTLGVLAAPGECGVDVAVGEGQQLGNRLDFGGPSFGFFAATEAYLRRMPGRIAGETTDVDGRRGFVLTLQTREQHIRREKATSNICTSQALNALAGVVYLTWLGRHGLVEMGELLLQRTAYARESSPRSTASSCCTTSLPCASSPCGSTPTSPPSSSAAPPRASTPATRWAATTRSSATACLVALTEQRTRAQIDRLADVLGAAVAAERSGAKVGASA
jgi:glycine dehydrogenase subunit 1